MSRFFSEKFKDLTPYTPGEQPKDTQYIKLNTNESPFSPSNKAVRMAAKEAEKLNLYPDPTCCELTEKLAEYYGVEKDEIILGNGSDEILNFAFEAFCDTKHGAAFPNITYGFYPVSASLCSVPYTEIPLSDNFEININDFIGRNETLFIANPNAPTGILLSLDDISKIVESNKNSVVVVDEAYIDFGGKSAVELVRKYDNMLVVQTFSKSRSMAGARLGLGIANRELIKDLNAIKYSINPYNINKMTMAAGIGVMSDQAYTDKNCIEIIKNREYLSEELKKLGFTLTDSKANFVFAKHDTLSGEEIYLKLKAKNILVRHFSRLEIADYNRITIGTREQCDALLNALKEILEK